MSQQISVVVNDETQQLVEELKRHFQVDSNAAVIRRALALAKVAVERAEPDNTVTMFDPKTHKPFKVLLAG